MSLRRFLFAVFVGVAVIVPASAQTSFPTPEKPVTVADAQEFMDRVEAELLALSNEGNRAGWVQETYITDDTEAISAKAGERLLTRTNELVIESRKFSKLQLPPDLARKFKLLQLNAAPTDPKLVAELTQTAVALDGMYGKGKYCRAAASPATDTRTTAASSSGQQCLGIEEIGVLMGQSRQSQRAVRPVAGAGAQYQHVADVGRVFPSQGSFPTKGRGSSAFTTWVICGGRYCPMTLLIFRRAGADPCAA